MIASDQESTAMIKGKRTKRQKRISHLSLTTTTTVTTTSSSTTTAVSGGAGFGGATTEEEEDEEEDMARCLILLAKRQPSCTRLNNVYQCKTCDRSFSSFQALGGHRASHMKPSTTTTMMTKTLDENAVKKSDNSCRNIWSEKIRVHECSMCGVEFISGQALGGHMRRHRTHLLADDDRVESVKIKAKKSRNRMLMLDLNLPAEPEEEDDHDDDLGDRRFNFGLKKRVLMPSDDVN